MSPPAGELVNTCEHREISVSAEVVSETLVHVGTSFWVKDVIYLGQDLGGARTSGQAPRPIIDVKLPTGVE